MSKTPKPAPVEDDDCPRCGDVQPWRDDHRPWAVEGRYSNGKPMFTPACVCGVVFDDGTTSESARGAESLALYGLPPSGGKRDHPFGDRIYCADPWHPITTPG